MMSGRLAACDACQKSKLKCDHRRPVCSRCRSRNKTASCVYRASPFKRRKYHADLDGSPHIIDHCEIEVEPQTPSTAIEQALDHSTPRQYRYPNPGFLGSSSHEAIFNRVSVNGSDGDRHDPSTARSALASTNTQDDDLLALRGARLLKHIRDTINISELRDLIKVWNSKGINLALADPLVATCVHSVEMMWSMAAEGDNWSLGLSKLLLSNSLIPISLESSSTISDFLAQFSGRKMRWETLGLVFAAASRSATDINCFAPLYNTEEGRRNFRKLVTGFSERCLELSLCLDCLNDLQLCFQYENWIVHTFAKGDQSYHSWRKLGDVIGSLYALGYHEKIEVGPHVPPFLADLRKSVFSRVYAADKNVAIFLGRPPRLNGKFCCFQLPSNPSDDGDPESNTAPDLEGNPWMSNERINYVADTRRSAVFSVAKEEILELFRNPDREKQNRTATEIQRRAEAQWNALPAHFCIEKSLKNCGGTPFERDFLVHTRFNYLQILFLLRLILVRQLSEPDTLLLVVSQEMLSLSVEAIALRDQMVNSGASLIWKIAHYCLPAAGVISLALLNNALGKDQSAISRPKMIQNLTVLVSEIQLGGIVQLGEPNYALLSRAAQTIQNVLNVVAFGPQRNETDALQQMLGANWDDYWNPWINAESWEFEYDFWRNLAGHPSLVGLENTIE